MNPRGRLAIWQFFYTLIFLGVVVRLAYWQLWRHDDLARFADDQYESQTRLSTKRGAIYDRNGQVMVTNEERLTLFAEPKVLAVAPGELADRLVEPLFASLDLSRFGGVASDSAWTESKRKEIREHVVASVSQNDRQWVPIWSRLQRSDWDKISAFDILGVGADPRLYRAYPDSSVAAQLLGFVGKDLAGNDKGYFGVEGYYDRELRGREGSVERERTALGLPLALGSDREVRAEPGRDLVLTIDKALQYQVEQKLLRGLERYGAKSGEVIIMNPHTGEILAMASFPNYDPSQFLDFDPTLYRTPSVSELYEPGSTLKVMTMAAAIEEGAITPETKCDRCAGPRVISGFPIRTWNEEYHPNINMRDALAKSDNTALVFVEEQLGKERFLSWFRKFGFGGKTNIDLQGEAQFDFREDKEWREIDAATASFGQGIAMTSLNLVRAVAALANGGKLVTPHVVRALRENDVEKPVSLPESVPVLKPETTKIITEMMVYSASQGDAKWTDKTKGIVAGKTGTAQIAENGKYQADKTLTSFIGFAPAENPQIIMLVKLREPTSSPWGSETAAPLWFDILSLLI